MPYKTILVNQRDGVLRVTLNRPDVLNAISTQMLEELDSVLSGLPQDARCLLLSGSGRAFSSGHEMVNPDGTLNLPYDAGLLLETSYNPLLTKLRELPIPVVVALNGIAAGAGCSLALAGDFILAAESSSILLAFVKIGLVPDAGVTWTLTRALGPTRALEMMMLGERVPAQKLVDWGLLSRLCKDDLLQAEAEAIAIRLAQGPRLALRLIRSGVRAAMECNFAQMLELERRNQFAAGRHGDGRLRRPHLDAVDALGEVDERRAREGVRDDAGRGEVREVGRGEAAGRDRRLEGRAGRLDGRGLLRRGGKREGEEQGEKPVAEAHERSGFGIESKKRRESGWGNRICLKLVRTRPAGAL